MEPLLAATLILAGIYLDTAWIVYLGVFILAIALFTGIVWYLRRPHPPHIARAPENPILKPSPEHGWESEAVFNPAAVYFDGRVHLLYRALGGDGISRIGYASSADGIHFDERLSYPVFVPAIPAAPTKYRNPFSHTTTLIREETTRRYNRDMFASGGGWGGSEDPRAVVIDDKLYMTFCMFESWQSMRMAVTSISKDDFSAKFWHWSPHVFLSPANQTNKNWVLFPEKIGGKYAILHALTPDIMIEYVDSIESITGRPIESNNHRSGRPGEWDEFVRGAAAPPIKTSRGWLLFYHGMKPGEEIGYKVGAMLLDLNDPTKILYRAKEPILVPSHWYENDWKFGVVYASGAVVKDGTLYIYYGGGDKTISVATAPLEKFLDELTAGEHSVLKPAKA
jgi:beta-1,2-mannobiose phosphorylase / 1,2-beta-oligomannan phosphorylase